MRPRVIYVTSQFPYGTREAFLAAEVRALVPLVGAVTIVSTHPRSRSAVAIPGTSAQALTMRSRATWAAAMRTLLRRPRATAALFAAMCLARYRPAAKLKNIAVFVKGLALADICRVWEADIIHVHWLTTPSTVAAIAARLANIPFSISAHRFDLFADNWLTEKLGAARFVRVISERAAGDLRARTPRGMWNRIRVLHLGVDPAVNVRSPRPDDPTLRVLAIGFLTPVKGHRDLIAALALLRDRGVRVQAEIAGDGPLRAHLQDHIDRLGLAAIVRLRGFVAHDSLMTELGSGAFDVVAHPSTEDGTDHEGIPVALMEAMSFEVPCVATRTGSIAELVDATCGVLVPQRDPAALADALQGLAQDEALRRRLGSAARERVVTQFAASRNAHALLELMLAR